jgi:glycosyltransferase involved in cell wall biosynthesis
VTPSYNQGKYLEDCLLSVKEQSYPALEHIVMDGASTDGTVEILKSYSSRPGWQHLRWKSDPDGGQSDALNKGFRLARGHVVGWLNSDDRYRPDCFRAMAAAFAENGDADVIYGDYTYINENGRVWRIRREIDFSWFMLLYLHMLYIPTPSSFFRRRIFDEGNLLDTKLHYAMDYEFILRLARQGYVFRHIPALVADFRLHAESKTGAHADKQRDEHNAVGITYSDLLQRIPSRPAQRFVQETFRVAARALRYKEKLLRGYYAEQYRPSVLDRAEPQAGLVPKKT